MSFAWHEIRDYLIRSSSTLSFQRSFEAIRRAGSPLAQFRDPAAMLDALHRGAADPNQKNLILVTLVQTAQSDGPAADCALTLMLLALWPGLDAIHLRSVCRKLGAPDEVSSDILARATEVDPSHRADIAPGNIADLLPMLSRLRPIFGPYGSVQFMHCSTGQGRNGRAVLNAIARAIGVPVSAAVFDQLGGGVDTFRFEGPTYTAMPGSQTLKAWCSALPDFAGMTVA